MSVQQRLSTVVEVEEGQDAIEFCYREGWSDGLPVVPPTVERVEAMLAAAGRAADEVLGMVAERRRTITVEKVAANAVLAGCLPSYFPVVLAAAEGMLDARFSLIGPSSSTAGAAIMVIVNGPICAQLGLNGADNLFGPGKRANATIGRALRLLLMNACGAVPGLFDRSTFGHPGKYTYCIAENEAESPWLPLHVERGVPADVSAVTVFAAWGPVQLDCRPTQEPETIVAAIADLAASVVSYGSGRRQPELLVVIGYEHMVDLARHGWDKARIREYLAEHANRSVGDLKRLARISGSLLSGDEGRRMAAVSHADDILVVVGGGHAGRYSIVVPGWLAGDSQAVTRPVQCLNP